MVVVVCITVFFVGLFFLGASAETPMERRSKLEEQIANLEKEAAVLDAELTKTKGETQTLKGEIQRLMNDIKKRELEIKKINLAIRQADIEIDEKNKGIGVTEGKMGNARKNLASNILLLYSYEQESILEILLRYSTISKFFSSVDTLYTVQASMNELILDLRHSRNELQEQKDELEEFQVGQEQLRGLADAEKRSISRIQKEKDRVLQVTKGKEAVYQTLLTKKKNDIAALRTQLFYLEKTGITAEDALKYAELAASRAGIRTAFLLAILEVETGKQFDEGVLSVGTNLGTGNWKTDMYDCYVKLGKRFTAEAQKNAFFKIVEGLGLNPNAMPVSRRPNYGCGGAMGPAQFIPTTWLLFSEKVSALTGHRPANPWNIEDAFTASAVFLSESGAKAKTLDGEKRAARTYISGRPTCSTSTTTGRACNYYANRVYNLSIEIDKVI